MLDRIKVAVIGIPVIVIVLVFLPKFATNILIALIALGSLNEFIKSINNLSYKPIRSISYASCAFLLFIGQIPTKEVYKWFIMFIALIIIVLLIYAFFVRKGENNLLNIAFTIFGILYIPVLLSFFALTYYASAPNIENMGKYMIWYIIIGACITDIFAYFIGIKFGKHKLCPNISPKKTFEGAVGGLVFCVVFFIAYSFVLNKNLGFSINYISIGLVAIIVAIFAQLGDLVASSIKRSVKVKDFGAFLPGHGGILDRIDSLLFVSPLFYYLLTYFPGIIS